MNEIQEQIQIENFIDELFVAIEEHSLLKANICIKIAVMMKLNNHHLQGEGLNFNQFEIDHCHEVARLPG